MAVFNRKSSRITRHKRIRKKIKGTKERPRMSIMISNKYMYVQFIDDDTSITLASASTLGSKNNGNNIAVARELGKQVADIAVSKNIKNIVIDRGGYKFHGRVKAIVDAACETGLLTGNICE